MHVCGIVNISAQLNSELKGTCCHMHELRVSYMDLMVVSCLRLKIQPHMYIVTQNRAIKTLISIMKVECRIQL